MDTTEMKRIPQGTYNLLRDKAFFFFFLMCLFKIFAHFFKRWVVLFLLFKNIEVKLTNNIILVSGVQHNDCIFVFILPSLQMIITVILINICHQRAQSLFSLVRLFTTPWMMVAHQAPLSMRFFPVGVLE